MKIQHTTLLLSALLSAAVLVAAPVAGAATGPTKPKADLAVTKVTIPPNFVVVEPSGRANTVSVKVSVKNVGHATAAASVTKIVVVQNGRELEHKEVDAGRLAPGQATTQIAVFHGVELALGFVHGLARADVTVTLPVSDNDLKLSSPVPVIARRWLARGMEVEQKTPALGFGGNQDDITDTSFVIFTFSHVDANPARFAYKASGEVDTSTSISGECNAQGDDKASMSPWGQDSGLFIAKTLKLYEATVRASLAPPFQIGVTCEGIPATQPLTVRFHDLLTTIASGGAPLPMHPTDARLTGHASSGAISTLNYSWTIVADVP
jgi:hypothetical protein